MSTILVTGTSGHLGANLVRRLLADRDASPQNAATRIRVLLRHGSDNRAVDGLDVERYYGDLRDPLAVQAAVDGCERIFHVAAKLQTTQADAAAQREIYDSNVIGTRNLLAAAKRAGVKRVCVTSSFSAVGHDPVRPSDETVPFYPFEEHMAYEVSKAWMEHECLLAVRDGLDVVIATSCAILGPNDFKPSRMGQVLIDFANGDFRAYIPGGFEFVASRDIVEGHMLAMEKGRTGHKYIFSTEFTTVDELMGHMEEVTGKKRPIRLPPAVMAVIAEITSFVMDRFFPRMPQRLTPGAVRILRMQRRADTSKARNELGFRPTSVRQAIADAYAFFVDQGLIRGVSRPAGQAASAPRNGTHGGHRSVGATAEAARA
jgi:nucleoside-diphosphate-sugar epimerase